MENSQNVVQSQFKVFARIKPEKPGTKDLSKGNQNFQENKIIIIDRHNVSIN